MVACVSKSAPINYILDWLYRAVGSYSRLWWLHHPPLPLRKWSANLTMILTLETLRVLRSKGFVQLYTGREEKWREMVENATTYAKTFLTEGDRDRLRPSDIAEVLQNALKFDPHFEKHLTNRKIKEKHWVKDFADYIMDQIYPPAETNKKEVSHVAIPQGRRSIHQRPNANYEQAW